MSLGTNQSKDRDKEFRGGQKEGLERPSYSLEQQFLLFGCPFKFIFKSRSEASCQQLITVMEDDIYYSDLISYF